MTDLLSAIREFRSLEEKRRAGDFTQEDGARWEQLRGMLGERAPPPAEAPSAPVPPIQVPVAQAPEAPPVIAAPMPEQEPPLVDADLLEEQPLPGFAEPMAAPFATPPEEPPMQVSGWPSFAPPETSEPVAEPVAAAPVAPAPTFAADAEASRELLSGDEALLSVTEFLVQAPLVLAPAGTQPASPPPESAWPQAPVAPAPWPLSPSAAAPTPLPPLPPTPGLPWGAPVPQPESQVADPLELVSTGPMPWVERRENEADDDPDRDLPMAMEPVAVEPKALQEVEVPKSLKAEHKSGIFVRGEHRVVVHTLVGALKRGTVHDLDLLAPQLELSPQGGGDTEWLPVEELKAVFFMLAPGDPHLAQAGQRLTVTFHDGRQITGFSTDYRPGDAGFFLIPADTRSNTARIYVFRAALRDVMAN